MHFENYLYICHSDKFKQMTKNWIIYILLFCALILSGLLLFNKDSRVKHKVLIIQSYESSCKANQKLTEEIMKDLDASDVKTDKRCFYLDCESVQEKAELWKMHNFLDSLASSGWRPDVILVNDDQATYSLLKCGHPIVHTTPVVFSGVNFPNWKLLKEFPNATGFEDKINVLANLALISKIKKTDKVIFTILDSTFLDRKVKNEIYGVTKGRKVVGFMTPNIPKAEQFKLVKNNGYVILDNYPLRLKNSAAPSFLWSISHFSERHSYLALKRDFISINMPRINSGYNFTGINEDFNDDHLLLGGYFTPMEIQAKDQVDYAVKILKGTPVSALPIRQSQKESLFDWKAMQQKGLQINDLPSYCKIINISFAMEHPILYEGLIILLIVFVLFSFIVLHFMFSRERKRKRAALATIAKDREIMKLALEGSNTFAWSMQGGLITFENSFWRYAKREGRPLLPEDLVEYIHPSYQKLFRNFIDSTDTKKSFQLLASFDQKNFRWWDVRCSVDHLSNGDTRTSGVVFDIQNFKNTEEELKKARILAEKAEMKQSFIANMSHEIRTPINAIMGFSSLLTDSENLTKEERDEYIGIIRNSNKELLNLIDEVLLLTEIDSGVLMFKTEPFNIRGFVKKVYSDFTPKVPSNVQFIRIEDNVDLMVATDPNHLADVLVHLLDNAVKFTTEGSIRLGYQHLIDKKEVEIYVEDTGHGIPDDELHLIFSRFYKRDIFKPGVGLGLSVCKTIVEKLNGRLSVRSQIGKGSRFSVFLRCSAIEK